MNIVAAVSREAIDLNALKSTRPGDGGIKRISLALNSVTRISPVARRHLGDCAWQIVTLRNLVPEASDPEAPLRFAQQNGSVFQAGNADLIELAAHGAEPVEVAENRLHPERSGEASES
jgi:hypothetical protein